MFMRKLNQILLTLCLLISQVGVNSASASELQCRQLPQLFDAFFRNHYSTKSMTDETKTRTVDQFIKALDSSKTVLLQADVDKLRHDLPVMFNSMRGGDCSALDGAAQLLVQRSQEIEKFVKEFLNADYKLDETTELVLDPEKRVFPKTTAERDALVKKYVHFQISNYLLTDMKLPEAKKQLVHRYELVTKRAKEDRAKNMVNTFAESFALALDPHSTYMSKDTLADFRIQMDASLEGIGASLSYEDGFTVVEDTIPGGGAARSKMLMPKDKIIAVKQDNEKAVSVIDMDLRDVVAMIRGPKGTKVTLTILRQGKKSETFDVTIVRDKIDIKDQLASITYETRTVGGKKVKVGILDLPSFYGGGGEGSHSCFEDVKRLLLEARKEKVDAIVLNLSRNGGGLLEDAVKIVGLFIRKGGVVGTKDSEGHIEILNDDDEDVIYNGPLVVLTSRLSASASEIVAGALKDYHRAVIVGGDHTFGKGTVQKLAALPLDLGGMKVTIGMFFVPGGKSTQHLGVASDIRLPSIMNSEDIGEVKMDYSLPPQSIPQFISAEANLPPPPPGMSMASDPEATTRWLPVDDGLVKKLADKSAERVAKDPKFIEVRKEIEETEKNKGIARLAELRKKAEAENKEDKKKKKNRKEKNKDMETPFLQEGANIAADMVQLRTATHLESSL